jgi:hypothetical protein
MRSMMQLMPLLALLPLVPPAFAANAMQPLPFFVAAPNRLPPPVWTLQPIPFAIVFTNRATPRT